MKDIQKCKCSRCGAEVLTLSGASCNCGGVMKSISGGDGQQVRKAYGLEDTDLRKAQH